MKCYTFFGLMAQPPITLNPSCSENRPVSVIGGEVTAATEDGEVTIPLDDDVDEVRIEERL